MNFNNNPFNNQNGTEKNNAYGAGFPQSTPSQSNLFGNSLQNSQSQSNLFGNSLQNNQPQSNLFGNSLQNSQPQSNLFGNSLQNSQPQSNLFNNSLQNNQPQSNLFGSTLQSNQSQSNLFGNSLQNNQSQSNLFNNSLQNNSFLGNTAGNPLNTSFIGNSLFNASQVKSDSFYSSPNNATAKAQELVTILENIENCYNPSAPQYKFTHVFYNINDGPIQKPATFPQDLWDKYFIPDSPLVPVILSKQQVEERKRIQGELAVKLAESKNGILKRLESLRMKREAIKNKLENVVKKFRMKTRKYVVCKEENSAVYRIQTEVIERERLVIREKRDEVLKHLGAMKNRLEKLEKRVNETIHVAEKHIGQARQLNKRY